jgi:hypothetical protein
MASDTAGFEMAPRRSGFALFLRRTTFTLLLQGCTIADLHEAIPAPTLPREFNLRARDSVLILRNYGGGSTPWSVKAQMEDTIDGVRLTGRLRYLLDRIYFAGCAIATIVLLAVAAGIAVSQGPGSGGFITCLVGAMVLGLVALSALAMQPSVVAKKEERAKQILYAMLEAG